MRRSIVVVLLAGFCVFALCGAGPKINVMSVGDSWAHGWVGAMEAVILSHGTLVEAHNKGIPGTTAELWADEGTLLLADAQLHLFNHPEIEWVVLSLGGNDLLDHYIIGYGMGDDVFDFIEPNLRAVIDGLLLIRPTLKIFVNGYDFLNFEMSLVCIVLGNEIFGGSTYDKNMLMQGLTDIAGRVAADYSQVYTTNTIGALQGAGGVQDAPNYYLPSPEQYFPTDDCIHPSANGGWFVLMDEIWDGFFGPLNEPTTTTTTTTSSTTTSTTAIPSTTTTTIPGDDDVDDDVDDDDSDDDIDDDVDDDLNNDEDDDWLDDDANDDDTNDDVDDDFDVVDDDEDSQDAARSDDDNEDGACCG